MRDLTKIQLQEKAKRNRNRLDMKRLRQRKGTPSLEYRQYGEPIFKPIWMRLFNLSEMVSISLRFARRHGLRPIDKGNPGERK